MSPPVGGPPRYHTEKLQVSLGTLKEWDAAHKDAIASYSLKLELSKKQRELATSQRKLSKLKVQRKDAQAEKEVRTSFDEIHSDERKTAETVKELENIVNSLTGRRDALNGRSDISEKLWLSMQTLLVTKANLGHSTADFHDEILKADMEVEEAQKQVNAINRVRLTIQHAHKYFSDALKVCDDLNPGSKTSTLSEGFGGEMVNMSKQNDYRDAITQAEKAQSCLDECIRCLEPYWYSIPGDIVECFEALKTSGVMQIKKIYELMYKGSSVDSNVRDAVKIMLEKQENMFKQLTEAAVWTQDRVPECEVAGIHAKIRREEVRGKIAAQIKFL